MLEDNGLTIKVCCICGVGMLEQPAAFTMPQEVFDALKSGAAVEAKSDVFKYYCHVHAPKLF